jgi:oligosaccharyltransferase complex subunit delta (ribophorin II)
LLSLNLSNNQILTIEDKTFDYLNSLLYLNLSNNLIYNLTGSLFSKLSQLETILLSKNKLSFVDKSYFKGLTNLKFLDLGYNEIMSISKDSFHLNSICLEQLILKSNEIRNFDVSINNVFRFVDQQNLKQFRFYGLN